MTPTDHSGPSRLRRIFRRGGSLTDIVDRGAQDDLLQMRNDLMTVFRPVSRDDHRLFPLRYARAGSRAAGASRDALPPIVILPDGPALASVLPYDVLRRMMAQRGLDVIMVEHRGVGLSRLDGRGEDLPSEAMRVQEVVDDVLAALDHGRVERAVLYGVGYGAYIAQVLAAEHPDRVHSLVLDSPLTGPDDEAHGQALFRDLYWHGTTPATAPIARTLQGLVRDGVLDGHRAGPVLAAVHDYGGPEAVGELVDLLAQGRGRVTWRSIREVVARQWTGSTPYVLENDLVAPIAHTELGRGSRADGRDLDPLQLHGRHARTAPPHRDAPYAPADLAGGITAPTLVLAGQRDLLMAPDRARELAERIHGAHLLVVPDVGHSVLDAHPTVAIIAAWWSAAGCADLLPERAAALAEVPRVSLNRVLRDGLRVALLAERLSPWAHRVESARARRVEAGVDPTGRRARRTRTL